MFGILSPGDNLEWDQYNQMPALSVFSKVSKGIIFNRVFFSNFKNNELFLAKGRLGFEEVSRKKI